MTCVVWCACNMTRVSGESGLSRGEAKRFLAQEDMQVIVVVTVTVTVIVVVIDNITST